MAPAKRKANTAADATSSAATKRQKKVVESTASSSRPSRTSLAEAAAPRSIRSSISGKSTSVKPPKNTNKASVNETASKAATKNAAKVKATDSRKRENPAKKATNDEDAVASEGTSTLLVDVPLGQKTTMNAEAEVDGEGPAYWLMKAEPQSRIEKGKDVKFSIDDLKAAKEPEGWDGMSQYETYVGQQPLTPYLQVSAIPSVSNTIGRISYKGLINLLARNNMRLMMKGDMAFFYHSNCKIPGIVGTMEIAQEHSVDGETAPPPVNGPFSWLIFLQKPPSTPSIPISTRNQTGRNQSGVSYMSNSSRSFRR